MAETTAIQWTDATVNFWWGCTKVGPGCDHCYAEAWDKRTGGAHWGAGAPRRGIKGAEATLCRLNRLRPGARVFLQSMSDIFDNEVPKLWFLHAWDTAHDCRNLRLQIVTKRLPMVERRLAEFAEAFPGRPLWPQHAGLIATVCNQAEADRDVPRLLDLKHRLGIPWVGLSIEPMLGPVDVTFVEVGDTGLGWNALTGEANDAHPNLPHIDWIICGGESGPHARPMHPDWARALRDQCVAAGVPFFFKQWGEWGPGSVLMTTGEPVFRAFPNFQTWVNKAPTWVNGGACMDALGRHCKIGADFMRARDEGTFPVTIIHRTGKACAGRKLDGREWNQFPGDAA